MHPLAFASRDRLLARIEELEHHLHEATASDEDPPIRPGEHLTGMQHRLVCALLARRGRIVPRPALLVAMYFDRPDADWPDARIIEAQVCKIRQKLAGLTIRTVIGRGYVIDAE